MERIILAARKTLEERGGLDLAVPVFAPGRNTVSHFEGWHIDYPYPRLRAYRIGRYRGIYAKKTLGLSRTEEEPRLLEGGILSLGRQAGLRLARRALLQDRATWKDLEDFLAFLREIL